MRSFLSNLTVAWLAVHTVLGCCWHHGHGCPQADDFTQSVESPEECEANPSFLACTSADSTGDEHHGPHECRGVTCTFLGPTKQNSHELPLQLHALPAAPMLCGEPSVSDAASRQEFFACDALLPPLRLHLIHRVLLI